MVQILSVIIASLGIGWLSGLSVSPVIATFLASLVGIGGGLVTGLRTVNASSENESSSNGLSAVNVIPSAVLIFGIALGAPLGIVAGTHQLFEPEHAPARTDQSSQGVLFIITAEHCDRLRARARDPNENRHFATHSTIQGNGDVCSKSI